MEMSRDNTVVSLTPRSRPIWGKAGADMEEDVGEMKVKTETMAVAAHFALNVQFLGLAGSLGEVHVTCGNKSVRGGGEGRRRWAHEVRVVARLRFSRSPALLTGQC